MLIVDGYPQTTLIIKNKHRLYFFNVLNISESVFIYTQLNQTWIHSFP